jgi:hypothetical protein
MARPKKSDTKSQEQEKSVTPLGDILKRQKKLPTYSMGITTPVLIPTDSIGYQVMIANGGFPINCISMSIGDPFTGKTSHTHYLANLFLRSNGDVIHIPTDGVLDEPYVSRFYDFNPKNEHEEITEPLQHFTTDLTERLKDETLPKLTRKVRAAQLDAAKKVIKEGFKITSREHRETLFLAQSAWRMRKVVRMDPKSMEDLEAIVQFIHDQKRENDPKITRPTLIAVDPISNVLPQELVEQEDSAGGRKMATAAYLHQFFRKWCRKLADAQIHLHLTTKQVDHIPKPYEFASELDKLVTIGGNAQKFAATILFEFKYPKDHKQPSADHNALSDSGSMEPFKEVTINISKLKIQGGVTLPKEFRHKYWLFTSRHNTHMDFDLPFLEQVFKFEIFGIKYAQGFVYIPKEFASDPAVQDLGIDMQQELNAANTRDQDPKFKGPPGIRLRRADAVRFLKHCKAWHNHIRDALGIAYQNIGDLQDTPPQDEYQETLDIPPVPNPEPKSEEPEETKITA